MTLLKIIGLSVLMVGSLGALYQYVMTQWDRKKYPPLGKMIDIGSYKIHMIDSCDDEFKKCVSDPKQPIVIMDAGIGCSTLDWSLVQPEIAKFARVIIYDRPGYGWSDASPLPRTTENIVEELRTMLQNAGVHGPYILVGHSFGGLNMQLFALKYPDEVAGLVLVDAVPEDVMNIIPEIFIGFKGWIYTRLRGSYVGIIRLINIWNRSFDKNNFRDFAYKNTITYFDTAFQELDAIQVSCNQVKKLDKSLGDMPLYVIAQGKQLVPTQGPCGVYSQEEVNLINQKWSLLQKDLVQKSLWSKQFIAEQSNHNIPQEQPAIIIQAVRDMIARKSKKE